MGRGRTAADGTGDRCGYNLPRVFDNVMKGITMNEKFDYVNWRLRFYKQRRAMEKKTYIFAVMMLISIFTIIAGILLGR
jgi:hypothetical protein